MTVYIHTSPRFYSPRRGGNEALEGSKVRKHQNTMPQWMKTFEGKMPKPATALTSGKLDNRQSQHVFSC